MNFMRPDEELCDKLPPPWRVLMKSKEKERTKEKIMTEPNKENRNDKKNNNIQTKTSFISLLPNTAPLPHRESFVEISRLK